MSQLPMLNLGCGKTHFPTATPPPGHEAVNPALYQYPHWVNVDRVEGVGADKVFNLFEYPWPLETNGYDGAILAHIAEHIPHGIVLSEHDVDPPTPGGVRKLGNGWFDSEGNRVQPPAPRGQRQKYLKGLQDGWFAFLSELWRVLTPGAIVHIISPYAWSDGAVVDPTHTRYLTPQSFMHALDNDGDGGPTFRYDVGCNFKVAQGAQYRITQMFAHLLVNAEDDEETRTRKGQEFELALMIYKNVVYDFYMQLEVVK